MDKKLVLAAVAALAIGFLAGKGLGGGKGPSYLDGRVNGCNTAMNALTGGALQCEAKGNEIYAVSPMLEKPVNLDQLDKKAE